MESELMSSQNAALMDRQKKEFKQHTVERNELIKELQQSTQLAQSAQSKVEKLMNAIENQKIQIVELQSFKDTNENELENLKNEREALLDSQITKETKSDAQKKELLRDLNA